VEAIIFLVNTVINIRLSLGEANFGSEVTSDLGLILSIILAA
jgi:hypothetical protein